MLHFARPSLAKKMADDLMGKSVFGDACNGLFLTSPRRTGKSTFLQSDLGPELSARGVLVVYTDLWESRDCDPSTLVRDAISRAIAQEVSIFSRAAKRSKLEAINLAGWLKIDTSKVGRSDEKSLADTLRGLKELSGKPVALIIDEAQQALLSNEGEAMMFALKSARDQMNRPGKIDLMLIMSGSDRDKLLRLVHTTAAPFYGSAIQPMPDLGTDFIGFVSEQLVTHHPDLHPIAEDLLMAAFQLLNFRPQLFFQFLGVALTSVEAQSGRPEVSLYCLCEQQVRREFEQVQADFLALNTLEQAVLWRLLQLGDGFRPYDADALEFYRRQLGKSVSSAQTQKALESLRTRSPTMLWKSSRGEYLVADTLMVQWYRQQMADGCWPPAAGAGGTSTTS